MCKSPTTGTASEPKIVSGTAFGSCFRQRRRPLSTISLIMLRLSAFAVFVVGLLAPTSSNAQAVTVVWPKSQHTLGTHKLTQLLDY